MLVTFSTCDLFNGADVEFNINLVSGPEYTTTPEKKEKKTWKYIQLNLNG